MSRVFLILALFAIAMLIANIVLGLCTGDYNQVAQEYVAVSRELKELEHSSDGTDQQIREKQTQRFKLGEALETPKQRTVFHILFGIAAALVTLLVNSIAVTYFIGTNRWCKEVVDTYGLDKELSQSADQIKRSTFPWAVIGMLVILAIIALGGAALPFGANAAGSASWVLPHYLGALAGVAIIGWSLLVQVGKIGENYDVITKIVAESQRIRVERGLDNGDGDGV